MLILKPWQVNFTGCPLSRAGRTAYLLQNKKKGLEGCNIGEEPVYLL